jgi:protein phosphatase
MQYVAASAQHIGGRGEQQDAFAFLNTGDGQFERHAGLVAVLADGMGGMAHGRQASNTGIQLFLEAYRKKAPHESIPRALLRSLHDANAAVYHLSQHLGVPGQVGSTFVAAVFHDNSLQWIAVGDSLLYLLRDKALHVLSTSHTYAQILDRAAAEGRITFDQALQDEQREALTSYLGIEKLTEVDFSRRPMPLQEHDRVVLASDGLFKTLSVPEIAGCLEGPDPQRNVDALIRLTIDKQRSYQDNVTVLCVEIVGGNGAKPAENSTTLVEAPTVVPAPATQPSLLPDAPQAVTTIDVPPEPPAAADSPKRRRWWLPY